MSMEKTTFILYFDIKNSRQELYEFSHLIIKIHNDALIICLAHCMVISWILKEIQASGK